MLASYETVNEIIDAVIENGHAPGYPSAYAYVMGMFSAYISQEDAEQMLTRLRRNVRPL